MSYRRQQKSGATTLEMAIALSLFLTLTLGLVDMGYGVFRQHVLSYATRQLARQAIVRGKLADQLTVWGPEDIAVTADADHAVAQYIAPKLVGWRLEEVDIHVEWIDGDNDVRRSDRVCVQMTAPYRPVTTFLLGNPSIELAASSTMTIAH